MSEIWKEIKGFEDKYKISNQGNIIALNYRRTKKTKILKQYNGVYKTVILCKSSKPKTYYVHRLV